MAHLTKGLFILVLMTVVITYMFHRVNIGQEENRKSIYEGAVKMASQYATMDVIGQSDINSLFDGNARDAMWVDINYKAIDKCRDSLKLYLSGRANTIHSGISNINIPLVGIIGYESINGELYDGTKLLPMTYDNGYTNLTGTNQKIRFTVGKTVFIGNKIYSIKSNTELVDTDGISVNCTAYLNGQGYNSLYTLRNSVVMRTVSDYIGMYCGSNYNKTTENTELGYDFYIGSTGFSENGGAFNENPSLIRGVGVYAVIDLYTGNNSMLGTPTQFTRSVTFGGAELRLNVK